MYKELALELSRRPVFYVNDLRCMYDSGAHFPVWCSSFSFFCDSFPDATKQDGKFLISGFGNEKGTATEVDVYCIPEFKVSDELVFRNLYVALELDRQFGCDLILSDTMFDKMSCNVDRLDQNRPLLRIQHKKDLYYVAPAYSAENSKYYTDIYNFTQEAAERSVKTMNVFDK